MLRKNHFIPSDGVPMLNPDWTIRTPKQVAKDKNGYPDDWIVILGKRYGPRQIEQSDEIETAVRSVFPSERVHVFDGEVGILEGTREFLQLLICYSHVVFSLVYVFDIV